MMISMTQHSPSFFYSDENQTPLRVLYDCMKYGIKAKVWIRRYNGLRGIITGYIAAFDLHMNLVSDSPIKYTRSLA